MIIHHPNYFTSRCNLYDNGFKVITIDDLGYDKDQDRFYVKNVDKNNETSFDRYFIENENDNDILDKFTIKQ